MHLSGKPPSKPGLAIRAVIDHHVDRPEVDVQQCPELTGTNRSIGLINHPTIHPSHAAIKPGPKNPGHIAQRHTRFTKHHNPNAPQEHLDDLVAIARANTPDPIPNSDVKSRSANGTAPQDAGE